MKKSKRAKPQLAWLLSVLEVAWGCYIYIYITLGEARRTRHRWPLGDEGKKAKKFGGGGRSAPLPLRNLSADVDDHIGDHNEQPGPAPRGSAGRSGNL